MGGENDSGNPKTHIQDVCVAFELSIGTIDTAVHEKQGYRKEY